MIALVLECLIATDVPLIASRGRLFHKAIRRGRGRLFHSRA